MDFKEIDVKKIYDEIYSLCTFAVLQNTIQVDSFELLAFQDKCRYFFRLYNEQKQKPTVEEKFCRDCFGENEDTFSEIINKAYHSVLFADTLHDEERYFLEKEQCGLLMWNAGVSPYRDLQKTGYGFVKKQDIRLADFELMFKQLRDLLKLYISDKSLFEKLNPIIQNFETKYLKYTQQSLERH